MREIRTPGSVRGDRGNPVPYRDLNKLFQPFARKNCNWGSAPGDRQGVDGESPLR